jgi:hypothetical protein
MTSVTDDSSRESRKALLLRMFREVHISPSGSSGIDRTAILKIFQFLEGEAVLPFHVIGAVRRSGATPRQLVELMDLLQERTLSGLGLEEALDVSLLEVQSGAPRILLANGTSLSPSEFGYISVVNGFAQAGDSLEHCFATSPTGSLRLGTAILKERLAASLYLAMRDAGTYYWYVNAVLNADDSTLREFERGVRDGLLALDVGGGRALSINLCQRFLSTLRAFAQANGMDNKATSSPVTELLLRYWLEEYASGDSSLAESWNEELGSVNALWSIHALSDEVVALHSALATEIKPTLLRTARE